MLSEDETHNYHIPTVKGNHHMTIDSTLQSSPEKKNSSQERDLPSILLGQTIKLESLGIMKFKLQRFVFEYATEFKKMQQEIGTLKKKNAELELELKGFKEKETIITKEQNVRANRKV